MQACFKAYAFAETKRCMFITPLTWVHPQEVTDDLKDFMRDVYEIAKDDAMFFTLGDYDWITVVAYDLSGDAIVACDYERRHPTSTDYWYDDEIDSNISKLGRI